MQRVVNRRVVLRRRPAGRTRTGDFGVATFELGEVPPGHLVLRVILIQIAPAARAVMTNTTPFRQTDVGDGILCALVGTVVATPVGGPALGSMMTSYGLWEEYAVVPVTRARPVIAGLPLSDNLGPLGLNGLTAYFGMTRIGAPASGQTVVVSAAAGGVGHLAGQLARLLGAQVVGITGSDAKNQRLHADFGFDRTVNHRSPTFLTDLASACPAVGADVFFDTVGGPLLDAMLPLMNRGGRIVCCGATAHYEGEVDDVLQPGPRGIPQLLINRNLRMEGFETADFHAEWDDALGTLSRHRQSGSLRAAIHEWHGIESAPDALIAVLRGDNFGQAMVRLEPDPA